MTYSRRKDGGQMVIANEMLTKEEKRKKYMREYRRRPGVLEKNRLRVRKWQKRNAEGHRQKQRRFYSAHREQQIKRAEEYCRKHPEKKKEQKRRWARKKGWLWRQYRLTRQDKEKMYASQQGRCSVCGERFDELCVDHNHITGQIRNLLCRGCNSVIGHSKESIGILEKAIDYLKKWNGEFQFVVKRAP